MAPVTKSALFRGRDKGHFTLIQGKGEIEMKIIQKLSQYATYQRTVRALNGLDRRQLADIGVERSDIALMARGLSK
jgi:uncharacterized protein YjiS (DUF1127 family)